MNCTGMPCTCLRGCVPDRVFDAVLSIPSPRPPAEQPCGCAKCVEERHLEAERQTWRELDRARRERAALSSPAGPDGDGGAV